MPLQIGMAVGARWVASVALSRPPGLEKKVHLQRQCGHVVQGIRTRVLPVILHPWRPSLPRRCLSNCATWSLA